MVCVGNGLPITSTSRDLALSRESPVRGITGGMKLEDAKSAIDELKASGVDVGGCSYCARLVLKVGAEPAPCPICGALVTARKATDPRATDEDKRR